MPSAYALAAASVALLWASCAFIHPAVRAATVNGLRCVARYPDLWRIPAFFGMGYAAFQFAACALFHWRVGDLAEWFSRFDWNESAPLGRLVLSSLLPTAERTASVFTIFTATFPLSAFFALLLVFNVRGMLAEMARALCRRLGRPAGASATIFLFLAALAAAANPAAYLLLPEMSERAPFIAALGLNFLAAIFEMLLGIFFLTYLMLMSYAWMRGLHFERRKLLRVAMRRTGFVVKWSLPLSFLAMALIVLPLDLGILLAPGDGFYEACAWFSSWIGRPALTAVALAFCPVQAILVFHNESLRAALRGSTLLLRKKWTAILPFLVAACSAFLALDASSACVDARLGAETPAALGARILAAWLEAMLAGWLIASWVCLYKSLTAVRKEILF